MESTLLYILHLEVLWWAWNSKIEVRSDLCNVGFISSCVNSGDAQCEVCGL